MWTKWMPWRFILRQAAKKHNVLDPFEVLSQISRFAQPADIVAPSELLRAGFIFHTRGLINSQAIQHNLDWVWPYWVECQFNPNDQAFIPRAFSLTHVNLTHRNWTAVGTPNFSELPIVDPRGLLTPFWDGWSIDCWLIDDVGKAYMPSRANNDQISQELQIEENISVLTSLQDQNVRLTSHIEVISQPKDHICRLKVKGFIPKGGWISVSLRPFNPEGVSFIRTIKFLEEKNEWLVDKKQRICFQNKPDHYAFSYYRLGDVFSRICGQELKETNHHINCHVGMATAAVLFRIKANEEKEVYVDIPLKEEKKASKQSISPTSQSDSWQSVLTGLCHLHIPDNKIQFLYDASIRTIILHSIEDIYPGPYTYKRFWFRDAVLILNAMLSAGMIDRAEKMLNKFPKRQTVTGYFRSQEGEWDSNGQVLWIINRFYQMSGKKFDRKWHSVIKKGAHWIRDKRTSKKRDVLHSGLLPAGFSAEHFGPNDFYYWDDFWSIEGLNSAAQFFRELGDNAHAIDAENEAWDLLNTIEKSLTKVQERTRAIAIPSSPYRRMDSGAIGSIVCNYPLRILESQDKRVMATVEYLLKNCMFENGFFHDMSHSGINPYLTLHLSQVLLRAGDHRFFDLIKEVSSLASPTGQWPEAIHPITKGGCMGDGQHVWAAAEWIMMIHNCFVREEDSHRLILCSGIHSDWYSNDGMLSFGPAQTIYGPLSLTIKANNENFKVEWEGLWHDSAPEIEVSIPGYQTKKPNHGESFVEINRLNQKEFDAMNNNAIHK